MTTTPSAHEKVLIIGVDSQIGSALSFYFKSSHISHFGTTRKPQNATNQVYLFDLEHPDFSVLNQAFTHAIFCAAVTNIAKCENDPNRCRQINVVNTIRLIELLNKEGTYIIYLSSNAVFNGDKPFYNHDDATCPATTYGLYKCEVENYLVLKAPANNCVLRLTKVISPSTPFINRWQELAEAGHPIPTFTNRLVSPVALDEVVRTICQLIKIKPKGLYQLGGDHEYSYHQYAQLLFCTRPDILTLIEPTVDPLSLNRISHNSLRTFLPYSQ